MNSIRRIPWVTFSFTLLQLAAAVVLVTQAMQDDGDSRNQFAFFASQPSAVGFFSHSFFHANLLHLLGNLVFLIALGSALEIVIGSGRFLLLLLLGSWLGAAAHWMIFRSAAVDPGLMGSSGAIASLIGYAGIRFSRVAVPVLPKIKLPAWSLLLLWLGLQVGGAFLSPSHGGGVAFANHLGGAVVGLVLAFLTKAPEASRLKEAYQLLEKGKERSSEASKLAAETILKSDPNNSRAILDLADAHRVAGDVASESSLWKQVANSGPEQLRTEAVQRLKSLGTLGEVPSRSLMQIAQKGPETRWLFEEISRRSASDPERPYALMELCKQQQSAQWVELFKKDYSMDPVFEVAVARGLIQR